MCIRDRILDSESLAGNVIITPYVIAANDIRLQVSSEHHDDYNTAGLTEFEIPKSSILAIGVGAEVEGDYRSPPSSIDIANDDNIDIGEFDVQYDQDRIEILVNPNDRQKVEHLRRETLNADLKSLWPSLFLTAILGGIRRLEEYKDEGYSWTEVFSNALNREGYHEITQEELDEKALYYAQKLLDAPLGAMLDGFERMQDD